MACERFLVSGLGTPNCTRSLPRGLTHQRRAAGAWVFGWPPRPMPGRSSGRLDGVLESTEIPGRDGAVFRNCARLVLPVGEGPTRSAWDEGGAALDYADDATPDRCLDKVE
jgi:hypothetical protein